MKTKTDSLGKITNFTYDDHNRLVVIAYPDATQANFSYDAVGSMISASNQNISYGMTYDPLRRMISVVDSLGRTITSAFDASSNRTVMTSPLGTTSYSYTSSNQLASLTDYANGTFVFDYDMLKRRVTLSYPNGVVTSYVYNPAGHLTSLVNRYSQSTLKSLGYTHDTTGNRLTMTDNLGTRNYTYDGIYQLLQATNPSIPTEQFSYDPVGNRLGTTVNAANRLIEDATFTYAYNNNGSLIRKTNKTSGTITDYTYDAEMRLIQVSEPGMTASFKYDPFGRRIEKNANGTLTRYLYDREDIIARYDSNNQVIAGFTHGPGIDEPLSMQQSGQMYYYHQDGLGSVTMMTNGSGAVAQSYDYSSFGGIIGVTDPNLVQPYAFTSREYDQETGLYYYRARYYDPKIGRFITTDPIGFKGGDVNYYRYVGNNPVNNTDPEGTGPIGNIQCGYYASKFLDAAKKCRNSCDDSLEDMAKYIEDNGSVYLGQANMSCVCSKMGILGPKECAAIFAKCFSAGINFPPKPK